MPRPRKYTSKKTQDAGARHLSCEACRKRKSKCTRTFPCTGCTERNQECVWTSKPLERATPDVIEENKAEITRLQRVVRQLEAMIAERDAERAMYFPPTPPQDPIPGSGAHDFGDWEDIEAFFDPTDADSETSNQPAPFSNQLPPLNFDYRNESYSFPGQPQSPLDPLEPVWPPRSRAST
ncbi:hypothetical protein JCM16303_004468 [Sporobolomyces ruberrimus]